MRCKSSRVGPRALGAVLGVVVTAALAGPAARAGVASAVKMASGADAASGAGAESAPADAVYRGGVIYTVDAQDSVQEALAMRGGRLVYVGSNAGVAAFIGPGTKVTELGGHLLMPGLVDGHMHPLQGGSALLKCSLDYAQLTVEAMQAKVQACLDRSRDGAGTWLEVVNWFREGMLPAGVATSRATLDVLKTQRPIFVVSSFGHTGLVNSRGIALAGIGKTTQDPLGGRIERDAEGRPTGILEDAGQDLVTAVLPTPSAADNLKSAEAALAAMRRQGITTFLDAMALEPALAAFSAAQRAGHLTARAHFAVLITPPEGRDAAKAVEKVSALAHRFDQGEVHADPTLTVRNVKLFLDGVISAPALSGAMLEPYFVSQGAGQPWAPGNNRGPDVYFPAPVLRALLIAVAQAGFEPHMHADGDRAVHEALDGIEALRKAFPERDIRAAIAHDEIVEPQDFPRYRQLNAIPVLSFQWEKRASDTVDNAQDYLGPARYRYMEPAAFLADAGARIAYGSDWPVDPLDEWFALKVGVTRTNSPAAGARYAGRLAEDAGLTRAQVLRAITMNSSYELHQDTLTGSLEPGKLADFIELDRNVLQIPAAQIADVRVLKTVVGGRVVYEAQPVAARASGR